jgi:hypothetical protein
MGIAASAVGGSNFSAPAQSGTSAAQFPREAGFYRDWPASTDPAAHFKLVNESFDSTAIVNIHSGQADQARVIDFYGKVVLPRLKHSNADAA